MHLMISNLAEAGLAVILISSKMLGLLSMWDRNMVYHKKKTVSYLLPMTHDCGVVARSTAYSRNIILQTG